MYSPVVSLLMMEVYLHRLGIIFLVISGLERRFYCLIASLHTQNTRSKRDDVRVNARSSARRLKVGSEKIKWKRKKKYLINRRERKKSINNRCERYCDFQMAFVCYSGCLPLWLAQLACWLLHSAAHLYKVSCSKYVFTGRGGLPRVSTEETQVLAVQESHSNGGCSGAQQVV